MQQSIGFRWRDDKVMAEASGLVAKLALGAGDGKKHGNPLYESSEFIGFPTQLWSEAVLRTALTPDPSGDPGYRRGIHLYDLLAESWWKIKADEGEDPLAEEALLSLAAYLPSREEWAFSDEQIEHALSVFVALPKNRSEFMEPGRWISLLERYYIKAWPNHPQTPGSERWMAEEDAAERQGRQPHHSSISNPFLL